MTPESLDLVETEDLIDALRRRNAAVLVVTGKVLRGDETNMDVWYTDAVSGVYLAVWAQDRLLPERRRT